MPEDGDDSDERDDERFALPANLRLPGMLSKSVNDSGRS
jgi:hypothetical protein